MVIEFFTLWLQQPIRLLQLEAPRHGLTGGGNSFFSGGCYPVDCRGLEFFNRWKKNVYGLTKQRALIKKWIVHMQVKAILIVWKVAEDFLHGKTNATISRPWKFARQIGCTWRKMQCKRGQKVWPIRLAHGGAWSPLPSTTQEFLDLLRRCHVCWQQTFWPGARIGVTKDPLEEKNKEARRLQNLAKKENKKAHKAYKAGTCPRGLYGFDRPSCLAGPSKGEEDLQLEEEEGLRPLAARGKDRREGRMNQKAKKYKHSQLEATDHVKAAQVWKCRPRRSCLRAGRKRGQGSGTGGAAEPSFKRKSTRQFSSLGSRNK